VERIHQNAHRCPFSLLCGASMIALFIFLVALLLFT